MAVHCAWGGAMLRSRPLAGSSGGWLRASRRPRAQCHLVFSCLRVGKLEPRGQTALG
jgi:hypothetical protein